MKKKQLPSKREIIPVPPESALKQRAKFTEEFKRAAVLRLREPGQSATDLAFELGIRRNQLYKWEKKLGEQAPGELFRSPGRPVAGDETEVETLRRELAGAQEELAILKKLDAYLTRLKKRSTRSLMSSDLRTRSKRCAACSKSAAVGITRLKKPR